MRCAYSALRWLIACYRYPRSGSLIHELNAWEKDEAHWGPYIKQKERIYGLTHSISVQTVDKHSPNTLGQFEFFFDDDKSTTFISCESVRRKVPPFDTFSTCKIDFLIPEIKVFVEAIVTKKDLSRWREIEDKANKDFRSFIVTQ